MRAYEANESDKYKTSQLSIGRVWPKVGLLVKILDKSFGIDVFLSISLPQNQK